MKSIIFIAPPAAGKGTQSALMVEKYGIPAISTGDILRDKAKEDSAEGKEIKELLAAGKFVNDETIVNILKERLSKSDCQNGYILDGFPRNVSQAKIYDQMLEESNKDLGIVILLDLDEEIAKKRIIGRQTCPTCGAIYNSLIEESMPKKENTCDNCGSTLTRRADDNEETFSVRYATYVEKTAPLIDYYDQKGVLYRVESGISKEHTFNSIENILKEVNK